MLWLLERMATRDSQRLRDTGGTMKLLFILLAAAAFGLWFGHQLTSAIQNLILGV